MLKLLRLAMFLLLKGCWKPVRKSPWHPRHSSLPPGPLQERLDFGTICIYSCEARRRDVSGWVIFFLGWETTMLYIAEECWRWLWDIMGMFVYWGWLWQRCPFPIGWLINRGVSSETPEKQQTTGFYDDRWDWPAPGPNLFWPKGHYWIMGHT